MNFSVPGQGASLEPPLLRNVGGGTAVDEDVFEIHLSMFFAITQDGNLHKRITVRASFPLGRCFLQLSWSCSLWSFMNALLIP